MQQHQTLRRPQRMQPLAEHDMKFLNECLSMAFVKDPALHERAVEAAWLWRITPLRSPYINKQFFPELAFTTGAFTAREWLTPLFAYETVDKTTLQLLLDVLRLRGDARYTLKGVCHTLLRVIIAEMQRCVADDRLFCLDSFKHFLKQKCDTTEDVARRFY